MKVQFTRSSADTLSSRAAHRAFQSHTHGTKSEGHRYERRKVREYLRHSDVGAEDFLNWSEH
jgi:hypothetical protein